MDPSTLTTANVTLRSAAGTAVSGTVAYDATSRTATLTPSGALAPTTQYVATVKAAAKASDGTAMTGDVSWTFTTAAALHGHEPHAGAAGHGRRAARPGAGDVLARAGPGHRHGDELPPGDLRRDERPGVGQLRREQHERDADPDERPGAGDDLHGDGHHGGDARPTARR